ncbi:Coenzyme F420 hydrogenase/dehydrogenase, beta subunit C-terminal domain [Thioalkalivibrio sp. XN279]|uniref:Coenzyme F420 hydrogenase/dehydrogenase, beta subunit C-terminal domain n=1 Tax=Thioalkalivibrio sp. XN279 TaxID=2714953 RepID=UPI00140AC4AF|nr:hypothetical protein [Thioalkalivibrio sp. XN279]
MAQVKKDRKRFVFVGVPCHVKTLNALMRQDADVKNLAVATVAIFCVTSPQFSTPF